jgi:hypothetical protein
MTTKRPAGRGQPSQPIRHPKNPARVTTVTPRGSSIGKTQTLNSDYVGESRTRPENYKQQNKDRTRNPTEDKTLRRGMSQDTISRLSKPKTDPSTKPTNNQHLKSVVDIDIKADKQLRAAREAEAQKAANRRTASKKSAPPRPEDRPHRIEEEVITIKDKQESEPVHRLDLNIAVERTEQESSSIFKSIIDWSDYGQMKQRRTALEEDNVQLKQQLIHTKRQNHALNESLKKLKISNDQYEAERREIQAKSFREMSKSSWAPMEDQVIRETIEGIHKDLEDWVEDNCIESLEEIDGRGNDAEAHQLLLDFLQSAATTHAGQPWEQLQLKINKGLSPRLVLTAILINYMYMSIFKNPFSVLDALREADDPNGLGDMMLHVYQMLSQCKRSCTARYTPTLMVVVNLTQAHSWRSQLMRILLPQPPAGGRFECIQPVKEEIGVHIRRDCENLIKIFELSPARVLFTSDRPNNSTSMLADSWERAARLFTQLQTQLACVQWLGPKELSLVGQLFDSTYVEAHRSQSFQANEGKSISLVISPCVVLFGNEDGKGYEERRVVAKAVVLVLEDDDLQVADHSSVGSSGDASETYDSSVESEL